MAAISSVVTTRVNFSLGKAIAHNRLGLPIGFHAGLVWGYYIINVGNLVKYSGSVPDWITGVDRNPLAGIMGLLFLGCIAFWIRRRSLHYQRRSPS
jgi:membrane protease YdiL (CAAX protease family)